MARVSITETETFRDVLQELKDDPRYMSDVLIRTIDFLFDETQDTEPRRELLGNLYALFDWPCLGDMYNMVANYGIDFNTVLKLPVPEDEDTKDEWRERMAAVIGSMVP